MLKNPTGMKRNTSKAKFMAISHQVSTALLPDVSAGYCQRALVNESGIVRTQMGMHKRSEMVTVHGMPCVIPLCDSNSKWKDISCEKRKEYTEWATSLRAIYNSLKNYKLPGKI
jgi:hypothetical protein